MNATTMTAKILVGALFIAGGIALLKGGIKPLTEVIIDLTDKLQR